MRKFVKLICFVLSISIILSVMTACSEKTKNNTEQPKYSVATMEICCSDIFDGYTIKTENFEYPHRYAPETQKIKIGNSFFELQYDKTVVSNYEEVHIYESEEENISCRYYADKRSDADPSGFMPYAIAELEVKDRLLFPEDSTDTEQEYIDWLKTVLSKYTVADFNSYTYSCTTHIKKSNSGSASESDGFTLPTENETLTKYVFSYVNYYGEYKTSDNIEISIDFESGKALISFGCNASRLPHGNTKVDLDGAGKSLDIYIKNSVNKDKYKLNSYEILDKGLCYFDDRICCIYDVLADVYVKDLGEDTQHSFDIVVFFE